MPPVRLSEIPGLQETNPQQARMDPAAAAAPGRALGSVAKGIAQLGNAFEGIAEDVQNRENATTILETSSLWNRQATDLQVELSQEPDLAKREERVNKFLEGAQAEFDGRDLAPVVRDRLKERFTGFADNLYQGVILDNAREADRRGSIAFKTEYEQAVETGDVGRYQAAKDTARAGGIFSPEEEKAFDIEFDQAIAFRGAVKEIDADPWSSYKDLTSSDAGELYPGLNGDQLDQLRRIAGQKANAFASDFWQTSLNAALAEGPEQAILSKETLRGLAAEGLISAENHASYLRAWHSPGEAPFDQGIYNQAFAAITSYSPETDPSGAQLAQLREMVGTAPLPKGSLRTLSEKLEERTKPEGSKTHRLEATFARMTSSRFQNGGFGQWWSLSDSDGDPSTPPRRVINQGEHDAALIRQSRFNDAWDATLRNSGDDLDEVKARKIYDELFEKIVLDDGDGFDSKPLIPPASAAVDYLPDVDAALGRPAPAPAQGGETSAATPARFGGQVIRPAGSFYRDAVPTIFGGASDPVDNGQSAFGGTTGAGGKEGVAIPEKVLRATFPGRTKEWLGEHVRVVTRTEDGRTATFKLADLGTAEWVWQKNGKPTLDLTEGAVRQLGGTPIYKGGKLSAVEGLGPLSFALTTAAGGVEANLRGKTLKEAQDIYWRAAKPTSPDEITAALAAVKAAWLEQNMEPEDEEPIAPTLGPDGLPDTPGTATGDLLPDLDEGLPD